MAKPVKLYWDSCAWLGLLNGEAKKKRELEIVYGHAKAGKFEIWTSTLSMIEVRRLDSEKGLSKPLSDTNLAKIADLFAQPFVKPIPLDLEIANAARELWRTTAKLDKFQDAVHVASAQKWNTPVLHTYDHDDLLHLNETLQCRDGQRLRICYPNETTDGPLFAALGRG